MVFLVFLGAVVGPLGTFAVPQGLGISSLWPAMTIQALGGIWFGGWGMLAGTVFPVFSNWMIGGTIANLLGFIPANLMQGWLAAWYFRRYRIDPCLRQARDYWAFVGVACVSANLGGALLGTAALGMAGEIQSLSQWANLVFSWVMGNSVCCLVLGLPLMWVLSPVVVKSSLFCKTMWRSNAGAISAPRRFADMPILLKLLLGFLLAGIVPLLLVAGTTIRQIRTATLHEIGNENVRLAEALVSQTESFLRGRAALLSEVRFGLPTDRPTAPRLAEFQRRHAEFSDVASVRADDLPLWAKAQGFRPLFHLDRGVSVFGRSRDRILNRVLLAAEVKPGRWLCARLALHPALEPLMARLRGQRACWRVTCAKDTVLLEDMAGSEFVEEKPTALLARVDSGHWMLSGGVLVAATRSPAFPLRSFVASPVREAFAARVSSRKNSLALLVTGGIFLALIVGGFIARHIDRPIEVLIDAAHRIGAGKLETRIDLDSRDEIGELAQTLNQMSADLRRYIDELHRTTAEKERMARELEIAAELQRSLLPTSAPDLASVEISGMSLPAREAGGDFFDHFMASPGKLTIVLGDASGKGLPAALFAARAHGAARASVAYAPDAGALVTNINQLLCREFDTHGRFVTFFFGIIDLERLTLQYASAGHDPAILVRRRSSEVELIESTGPPLAIADPSQYELGEISLGSGDLLVLYSDGVTDSANAEGEHFGRERLEDAIMSNRDAGAAELTQHIYQATLDFSGGAAQFDDLTVLVLRCR